MREINLPRVAALAVRIALAATFLSAVADRFGLWGPPGSPHVAWGDFPSFLDYTGLLVWFVPDTMVPPLGWIATGLELILAVGLLSGFFPRRFALGSGVLLSLFAVTMTVAMGGEPALSYSVWTAAAAAFLLASIPGTSLSKAPQP